jgi:hypothetical protein
MTNKYIRKYPTSLATREMKMQNQNYIVIHQENKQTKRTTNADEEMEGKESFSTASGNGICPATMEINMKFSPKH